MLSFRMSIFCYEAYMYLFFGFMSWFRFHFVSSVLWPGTNNSNLIILLSFCGIALGTYIQRLSSYVVHTLSLVCLSPSFSPSLTPPHLSQFILPLQGPGRHASSMVANLIITCPWVYQSSCDFHLIRSSVGSLGRIWPADNIDWPWMASMKCVIQTS